MVYYFCGFRAGNEKFEEIRAGSLSRFCTCCYTAHACDFLVSQRRSAHLCYNMSLLAGYFLKRLCYCNSDFLENFFLSFGLFETLTLLIGNMPFLNVNDLQIVLKGLLSYLRMVLKIKLFTVTKDERVFYNLDFVLVLF